MTKITLAILGLLIGLAHLYAAESNSLAGAIARTWTPAARTLQLAASDAEPNVYQVLCSGPEHDPCDAGLEWKQPVRLNRLKITYASLYGRVYQPTPGGQATEYWDGAAWRSLPVSIHINDSKRAQFAEIQQFGSVTWEYTFTTVTTTRIRVRLFEPENPDSGHRCYAIRRIEAEAEGARTGDETAVTLREPLISGLASAAPEWLRDGTNLAVPASGLVLTPGKNAELHWPKPLLMNYVKLPHAQPIRSVEWWDSSVWRPVESLQNRDPSEAEFLPIATTALRLKGDAPIQSAEVSLNGNAKQYFDDLEDARTDLLGDRFRRMPQANLNGMRGLLLPMDFHKTAIGRPGDQEETIVLWNGTLLQFEGDKRRDPMDRWFVASLASHTVPGSEWNRTQTKLLHGFLPATVSETTIGDLEMQQITYVTSPDDSVYGTVVTVSIRNAGSQMARVPFMLAMGRRLNQRHAGAIDSVFTFAPRPTGYQLADAGHTVELSSGEMVLYAEDAGHWQTTGLEDHWQSDFTLRPGEQRDLRFFIPAPDAPPLSARDLSTTNWPAMRARFEAWWNNTLTSKMRIDVPEHEFNDIYKSLLAQALIITRDGDNRVSYGAYFYESYFGIEEGWPAVALAQYGFGGEAQKILDIMLSPKLMVKQGQHYQYRNGLDPWYAISIYRLTGDRAWLEKIAPVLKESAEWTIAATDENQDPTYGGLLPRHSYGGDIKTPANSLYANFTCWRGLKDTSLVFRILGQPQLADRYAQAADRYQARLLAISDQLVDQGSAPPFLPMSFAMGTPGTADYREKESSYPFLSPDVPATDTTAYLANYWNLFAPMMLEVKPFAVADPRANWIPRYIEERGGLLAGLTRFLMGLDAEYGKGYYESLLEQGDRTRFLTSFYGLFAHGMSSNLYSFPEVAGVFPTRTSNQANWREHMRELWNWYFKWDFGGWHTTEGDPLSAAPGMALQLLRMALVRETIETSPQDELRLLDGAPEQWFSPGNKISIERAPTFFGQCSLSVSIEAGATRAHVEREIGFRAKVTTLRLPGGNGRGIRMLKLNGQDYKDFSGDVIRLPQGNSLDLVATY